MAIKKEIKIVIDKDDAQKNIKSVNKDLNELDDTNKDATKSAKGIGTAFKGVGTVLKAIGIGVIIALFAKLVEVLSRNQKVVDFFSTSMEALSIAFNDLFNLVFDNIGKWTSSLKDAFENPKKTIEEFGDRIKENLIERFNSLLETFGHVGKALTKLFEGDFKGAWESVKDAGKESIDILTGVDDTVDKTVKGFNNLVESVSNYAKETYNTAKANVQLKNTAELATAQQARLVEQFDRLAEKQRQIRDEERNSIPDRIKANDELGKVLDEQEKSMLRLADLQIASAQANLNTNNSIENQVALIDALANKEGILAQVEGFRSEQLVNDLALKREQIELNQTISDAEKERQLKQLEFDAEFEVNEDLKLDLKRQRLEIENQIILDDLERKRELYKEGTQARVDAEQEYLDKKQEVDNKIKNFEKEELERKKIVEKLKLSLTENTFGKISTILGENSKIGKLFASGQALMNTYQGVTEILANKTTLPEPFGIINKIASIGTTLKIGLKAVKDINSVKTLGGGGGASASGGQQSPSFNIVGGTGANQIAQSIGEQSQPIQAYVVSGNVTSAQEMDRNIVENASL